AAADLAREGHPARVHRPGPAAGRVGGLLPGQRAARLDAVDLGDLARHVHARGLPGRDPERRGAGGRVAGHLAAARDRRDRGAAGAGRLPSRRALRQAARPAQAIGIGSSSMGREARCVVRRGGEQAEAKALLETDELIVRAPFRIAVPRGEITAARAEGDRLTVEWPDGSVELELGERESARWAHEIANPKTLADKLGVKAGQRVLLVGDPGAELVGAGTQVEQG